MVRRTLTVIVILFLTSAAGGAFCLPRADGDEKEAVMTIAVRIFLLTASQK